MMANNSDLNYKAYSHLGRGIDRSGMSMGTHSKPLDHNTVCEAMVDTIRNFTAVRPLENNWRTILELEGVDDLREMGYTYANGLNVFPMPGKLEDGKDEAKVLADLFDWNGVNDTNPWGDDGHWIEIPYKLHNPSDIPDSWTVEGGGAGWEYAYHCTALYTLYNIFSNNNIAPSTEKNMRGGTVFKGISGVYTEKEPNTGYTMFQYIGGPPGLHMNAAVKIARPRPHTTNTSQDGLGSGKTQSVSNEYRIVALTMQGVLIGCDGASYGKGQEDPLIKYGVDSFHHRFTFHSIFRHIAGYWEPVMEVHPLDMSIGDSEYLLKRAKKLEVEFELPENLIMAVTSEWDPQITTFPLSFGAMDEVTALRASRRVTMMNQQMIDAHIPIDETESNFQAWVFGMKAIFEVGAQSSIDVSSTLWREYVDAVKASLVALKTLLTDTGGIGSTIPDVDNGEQAIATYIRTIEISGNHLAAGRIVRHLRCTGFPTDVGEDIYHVVLTNQSLNYIVEGGRARFRHWPSIVCSSSRKRQNEGHISRRLIRGAVRI